MLVVGVVAAVTVGVVCGDDGDSSHGAGAGLPATRPASATPAPDFTLPRLAAGRSACRTTGAAGHPELLGVVVHAVPQGVPAVPSTLAREAGQSPMVGVSTRDLRGDDASDSQHDGAPTGRTAATPTTGRPAYGVDALPQTFFIRADGTIASHVVRGLNRAELDARAAQDRRRLSSRTDCDT